MKRFEMKLPVNMKNQQTKKKSIKETFISTQHLCM